MKKNTSPRRRKSPASDEWDRQWQQHRSKVGTPGYELPVGGPGGEEREFLAAARTPAKEEQRDAAWLKPRRARIGRGTAEDAEIAGGL